MHSDLGTRIYRFPDERKFIVRRITLSEGQWIDENWKAARPANAASGHWSWASIVQTCSATYAAFVESEIVALWAFAHDTPRQLPDGRALRVDYIETEPSRVRSGLGTFVMQLSCLRALEVGAEMVVFAVVPANRAFARRLGAKEGVRGWTCEKGLVPCRIDPTLCVEMAGAADAIQEKP